MTSDVDGWIAALDRIGRSTSSSSCPGTGPSPRAYLARQRAFLLEWTSAVAVAVADGLSREETIARVSFATRYPVDIGQEYMMEYIQERNAGALYDQLTRRRRTRRAADQARPAADSDSRVRPRGG